MSFKSPTQPYCRCCGLPIGKRTERHLFGQSRREGVAGQDRNHPERPTTRQEAQRYLNGRVMSISHYRPGHAEDYIFAASTWDGESYTDHLFCKQACAVAFGRMCATEYPQIRTRTAEAAQDKREASQ